MGLDEREVRSISRYANPPPSSPPPSSSPPSPPHPAARFKKYQTDYHDYQSVLLFCNVSLQDFTWFLPDLATRLSKFAIFENFIFTMILL